MESPDEFNIFEKSNWSDQRYSFAVPNEFAIRVVLEELHTTTVSRLSIVTSGTIVTIAKAVSETGQIESNMYNET